MQYTITEHFKKYFPEKLKYSNRLNIKELNRGIIVEIKLKNKPKSSKREVIFEIPGALKIETGMHCFPKALENMSPYEKSEYYNVYADEKGHSSYMEATISLHKGYGENKTQCMSIGVPLNLYNAAEKKVYLLYDGARFAWIANGEIVNSNYPIGRLAAQGGNLYISDSAEIGINCNVQLLESKEKTETKNRSIAFYSARGYNAWAGDIVNFYHNGTYHFLVLLDRHHHGNRFGGGAHTTYHMATRDFIHWENFGEIYEIQNQWEAFGTGTMFFWNGKYYYSNGFHTSRAVPQNKTGSDLLNKNYEKTGMFCAVTYEELKKQGLYPSGANYMVSQDGIHFVQGKKQIHCAENPSIYQDKNGGLVMYAGYGAAGVWHAPDIDGPWKRENTSMPVFDNSSPVRNSSECPSIFEWNGYKYIIMGFRGYWQSGFKNNEFTDLAAVGDDIYDGLCVPMVAECNGRYILAGWVGGSGWAFVTLHRELVQHKGGRLGIRWLPELTPQPETLKKVAEIKNVAAGTELRLNGKTSYYLEFRVKPQKIGRVGIAVSGSGNSFVFELNSARQKVQTLKTNNTNSFTKEVKALYEYIFEMPKERTGSGQIPSENIHTNSHDFAIARVRELTDEYTLKVIFHYEKKSDNLVMDAEIGAGRTFVSNRPNFRVGTVKLLAENAEISNLKLCELGD